MAYKSIITVAQRELCILSDEVLGSKVELPRNSRDEEGRKDESATQKGGPEHVLGYERKLILQDRSPSTVFMVNNLPSSSGF